MPNRIRPRTIDFVRLMEPVACRFWGNPTRRTERRLYWGNHSARTVDLGKGTWYDHENKVGGGVLELIEREAGCDRAGAMQWLVGHHFVEPTCAAVAITAKYNYNDERGRLLYQVVRIEPGPDGHKTFRQRRPDGGGGWIWNLQNCRRVLYRLRQLLAAVRDGQTVFIPEGEKDVLSLVSIGCVATTNAGGAGKWMDEYSEFLRGANCILLPDNDEAGRNHVATVAQQLKGAATSIRVIDLAQHWPAGDAPAKADVTDWLAAGGTKEQLEEIVAATPEYEAPPPDRAEEDAAYIDELARLSELEYQRRRPDAKERLCIKFGPLDKIVQQRRQHLQAEAQNEQILDLYPHWAVEPWHEPVDADVLLEAITGDIERYVATLRRRSIVPALWIMFTWVHDAATHSPLLLVNSAEPDSGKSTLLGFINLLAKRTIASVDITGPALYRSIDKWQPTFIVDEADAAFVKNDDLRSVVNSGWTRGQGIVRCDPDTHEPRLYSSFTPKAIGMKGKKLPDTTLSRAIDLVMKRKLPDEEVEDFSHLDNANLAMCRRMLARWAADNIETLRQAEPVETPGFHNRMRQNWLPLLAIARLAGRDAERRAWKAAQQIEAAKPADSASLGVQLLEDIQTLFDATEEEGLLSRAIVAVLVADEEKPWPHCGRSGKPLTQNQLARLLGQFGIISEEVHPQDEKHGKGYKRHRFEDAWKRYLPPPQPKSGSEARERANPTETGTSATFRSARNFGSARFKRR